MKKPTPEVLAIIEQLRQPDTLFEKLTGKAARLKLELLDQLMMQSNWWAVPSIFCLVFDTNSRVARKAGQTIHAIVTNHPTKDIQELDHLIRQISLGYWTYTGYYPDLVKRMPVCIKYLARFGEARITLLGIASFDASGYVREAAVKELGRFGEGAALPFILIRLGDWVKPVREAAEQAFAGLLKIENAAYFIENLSLATKLSKRTRIGNTPRQLITNLMKSIDAQPLLLAQLRKPFSPARRECIRLLLEDLSHDPLDLLTRITTPLEVIEELLITEAAFKQAREDELQQVYKQFAGSRYKNVRMRALSLLNQRQPELATEALWAALFDAAPVRPFAQYILKQRGISAEAIAQVYRQTLYGSRLSRLRASVAGLGDVGSIQDYELIAPFINHPVVGIVKTAIHALACLDPGQCYPTLVQLLQSPAVGVSKQAKEEILRNLSLADYGELWDVFMHSAIPHTRRNLIQIFTQASKWEKLGLLLGVLRHGSEEEQETARLHIQEWYASFNRAYIQPSPRQMEQIQEHLTHLDPQKDNRALREIRLIIQQRL